MTRARTLPAAGNHTATVTEVATELQRAYAPLQPVRLLGVRMAAFEEGGEAADAPAAVSQLALPV